MSDLGKVTIAVLQWEMQAHDSLQSLLSLAEDAVCKASNAGADFLLFPELFTAPLLHILPGLDSPSRMASLAESAAQVCEQFSQWATRHRVNIITGSLPLMEENLLLNVGYLCHRDGRVGRYEKLHATPFESAEWGIHGGTKLHAFDTDCGTVGILICYDSEFPELARLLADEGMQMLFIPFLTDTLNGYSRVRNCAMARAVENECYVAIAGCVGSFPQVDGLEEQYAGSAIFTPCDHFFPATGVLAEATVGRADLLVRSVDLTLLQQLHDQGSVRNLKNRRKDLVRVSWVAESGGASRKQ